MKVLLPFLCISAAGSLIAAEFYTGQAARAVIGQATFTRQFPGASERTIGAVSGLAYVNNTLLIVDSARIDAEPQNHRVLIMKNVSTQIRPPAAEIELDDKARCPLCYPAVDVVLGQPDFNKNEINLTRTGMRQPTAVATDGTRVVVADTDNNRILIWNSIPSVNAAPADVVVGQDNFTTARLNFPNGTNTPSQRGLKGPQGVWIQGNRLFVADTQNHRVLIWNNIPTSNGAPADVVLGQADFTSFVQPDIAQVRVQAKADNLLNPVSVTSDGQRLYVTDLGHNRVLIWNSIPTRNRQPADVVIGQPDMESSDPNNSTKLCQPTGEKDKDDKDIYPLRCAATLDFPRYALALGSRLAVADGGNDRVLIFNTVPTQNGQRADVILGQPNETSTVDTVNVGSYQSNIRLSSTDSVRTPMSLAWDGENLYVSDPFNRRVMLFTPADTHLKVGAVRNAASLQVYAIAAVTFSGTIKENDEATIKIAEKEYKYKILKDDTIAKVIQAFANLINAGEGDPLVLATVNLGFNALLLTSRRPGEDGNEVEFTVSISDGATIILTTSGARLSGGQDAARIAPGSLISIEGENLADTTASADLANVDRAPSTLGGVQVYVDGLRSPLFFVSPTRITAQMPFDINDATSTSVYIRKTMRDGRVVVTNATAAPIVPTNPGIFSETGNDPRPAIALHASSYGQGAISVDGTIKKDDVVTLSIENREYKYTVQESDTLGSVRDKLIELINANPEERVVASAATQFTRIRLRSKVEGPEGNGIRYRGNTNEGANIIITPLGNATCCANIAGAPITEANPALPGEVITIYAAGLGFVGPDEAKAFTDTGVKYNGPEFNFALWPIDSLAGARTANVMYSGLRRGEIGVYEIQLQLNSDLPTNPKTQLTIAQDVFISNIVTFPVVNPNPTTQP